MSRVKFIIISIFFLVLLILTSVIKNKTRILEKKLLKLSSHIVQKEKDLSEAQLEFYFLTSPKQLEKKVINLGINEYIPLRNSNIFKYFPKIKNNQTEISIFYNEKETKEN